MSTQTERDLERLAKCDDAGLLFEAKSAWVRYGTSHGRDKDDEENFLLLLRAFLEERGKGDILKAGREAWEAEKRALREANERTLKELKERRHHESP